jgi:two-component system, NtrC family, sensor kinase
VNPTQDARDDGRRAAATRPDGFDAQAMHHERMATLGELTAGIAHELNNPIGYIGSNLGTLRRYVDVVTRLMAEAGSYMEPERRSAWEQVLIAARWTTIRDDLTAVVDETRDGAEHLKNVVGDLKLLARTSAVPEQGCIDQCAASALSVLTYQLRHRCQVERDLGCKDALLLVRPQIIQLIINLVHNAAQAVAIGGRVRIRTRSDGGVATVTVEDDGPGVPLHLHQEIFQPFVTSKPGGTGLGLPIVSRIARSHGGGVTLDTSPDLGGARFTVELRNFQGTAVP